MLGHNNTLWTYTNKSVGSVICDYVNKVYSNSETVSVDRIMETELHNTFVLAIMKLEMGLQML